MNSNAGCPEPLVYLVPIGHNGVDVLLTFCVGSRPHYSPQISVFRFFSCYFKYGQWRKSTHHQNHVELYLDGCFGLTFRV